MGGAAGERSPGKSLRCTAELCQDFIDHVRVPQFNVIGGLNNGRKVAMTTLGHERGGAVTVRHLGFEREFWELVDTARKYGKTTDPLVRQRSGAGDVVTAERADR
jgi:alkylation response protein AidB-like acyl-CoA dehydrogenase